MEDKPMTNPLPTVFGGIIGNKIFEHWIVNVDFKNAEVSFKPTMDY